MSDNEHQDWMDLSSLRGHPGYQKLQLLWAEMGRKIMEELTKQSKVRGKDDSLRYFAGQWHGFDLAVGHLDRALDEISRNIQNAKEEVDPAQLLQNVRSMNGNQNGDHK